MANGSKVVIDPIHGDIRLSSLERELVDSRTFQRLRSIKQLGMAHFTYPNATHSRFAHSLGVLQTMSKALKAVERSDIRLTDREKQDLRLAALLHDVGHYPYSHLVERVDDVVLTEEFIGDGGKRIVSNVDRYPDHESLGETILSSQPDVLGVLGGESRAKEICAIFLRSDATDPQRSKLIHSSLDTDRLDYLVRDSRATGVPYGEIDINYLLNNLKMSESGILGIRHRALPAAEQYLMARQFMYRTVYYHKTTVGMEEACRQLLKRLRNRDSAATREPAYGMPLGGSAINDLARSPALFEFDDAFVDRIIRQAMSDQNRVVKALARSIVERRPPKLLVEIPILHESSEQHHKGTTFKLSCKHQLVQCAKKYNIPLGFFLFHSTQGLRVEKRDAYMTPGQASNVEPEAHDELIKVFVDGEPEPVSVIEIQHSLLNKISQWIFSYYRLYLVRDHGLDSSQLAALQSEVSGWASAR